MRLQKHIMFIVKYLMYLGILSLCVYDQVFCGFITSEIDKTVGTIEDQFIYTITISGKTKSKPQVPAVDGLVINFSGTSSNTMFINGNFSQEIKYTYIIIPEREGTFVLPSITLNIDGKQESSAPITIIVKDSVSSDTKKQNAVVFVDRSVSKSSVYVGEQILVVTKIYHKEPLVEAQVDYNPPTIVKRFNDKNEYKYSQIFNGQRYNVIELREVLIPLKVGDFSIPAFKVVVKLVDNTTSRRRPYSIFDEFFDTDKKLVTKRIISRALPIKVKPLPVQNKPKAFSGLVGNYVLKISLDKHQVIAGENINFTVQIDGEGDLQGFDNVVLKLNEDIKIYNDKPTIEQNIDITKGLVSSKVFKFALLPTKVGTYDLGDISLIFFSPEIGDYIELKEKIGNIDVTAGSNNITMAQGQQSVTNASHKKDVTILHDDILGIHRGKELLVNHVLTKRDILFFITIAGFMGLCFIIFYLFTIQVFKESLLNKSFKYQSYKKFKKFLNNIKTKEPSVELLDQIINAFKSYLGDKLNVYGPALTSKEFEQKIIEKTSNQDLATQVYNTLENLMEWSYKNINLDKQKFVEIISNLISLVKKIEGKVI